MKVNDLKNHIIDNVVVIQKMERTNYSLVAKIYLSSGLGLGLSLLYGHDSLILSLRNGGGRNMEGSECGKDSMSAGDEGTIVVLAAGWGRVDEGSVVVGEGKVGVRQGVAHMVGKPGLGLGLSSSIGGDC